jgi:hypothetical protein
MGIGAVQVAALARGVWVFIGTLVVTAITTYFGIASLVQGDLSAAGISDQDRLVYAVCMGLIAAFGAFGIRAGVEGRVDTVRAETGNMNSGDVAMASPKVEVVPVADVGAITVTGSVQSTEGAG